MKISGLVLASLAIIVDVTSGELIPGKIKSPRIRLESVRHVRSSVLMIHEGSVFQGTQSAHDPYALEILKRIAPSRKKMRKAGVPKQKIAELVLGALKKAAGEVISTLLYMPRKALIASAMHTISSETKAPVKKIPPQGTKAPMKKPPTQETIAPVKKIPPQETQAPVTYLTPQETQAPVMYLPPSEINAPVMYYPPQETQAPVVYLPPTETQAPMMYFQSQEPNVPVMYNQPQEWEYASTAYAQSDSDYVNTSYVPAGAPVPMDANAPIVSESQWTEPLPLERPITRIYSDSRRQPIRRPSTTRNQSGPGHT